MIGSDNQKTSDFRMVLHKTNLSDKQKTVFFFGGKNKEIDLCTDNLQLIDPFIVQINSVITLKKIVQPSSLSHFLQIQI